MKRVCRWHRAAEATLGDGLPPSASMAAPALALPRPLASGASAFRASPGLRRLAWATLAYTVLVILWGAFVRATGAGAGCGDHWPLCNGQVVPRGAETATLVEFGHRVTSGLLGFLILGTAVWAWRTAPRGHGVRRWAVASVVLTGTEAGIGAALVKLELVALSVDVARPLVMMLHLVNTLLLLGALGALTWGLAGRPTLRFRKRADAADPALGRWTLGLLAAFVVLGASGAVTALGDTLALYGGLDPAEVPLVATLVGLRVYHPLLAVLVTALAVVVVWRALSGAAASGHARRLGQALVGLLALQLVIGTVNVWLLAPVWLQLVHLAVTDAIWLAAVWMACEATGVRVAEPTPERSGRVPEVGDGVPHGSIDYGQPVSMPDGGGATVVSAAPVGG